MIALSAGFAFLNSTLGRAVAVSALILLALAYAYHFGASTQKLTDINGDATLAHRITKEGEDARSAAAVTGPDGLRNDGFRRDFVGGRGLP